MKTKIFNLFNRWSNIFTPVLLSIVLVGAISSLFGYIMTISQAMDIAVVITAILTLLSYIKRN